MEKILKTKKQCEEIYQNIKSQITDNTDAIYLGTFYVNGERCIRYQVHNRGQGIWQVIYDGEEEKYRIVDIFEDFNNYDKEYIVNYLYEYMCED